MHQVLVYSDSLSWGIVPTTRRRLPFDAENVIAASPADGIHLDRDQHQRLGNALAGFVGALPGFAPPSEP